MKLKDIEDVIDMAALHGEDSAPDMEVGDLQEALRLCWRYLSAGNKKLVLEQIQEAIDEDL